MLVIAMYWLQLVAFDALDVHDTWHSLSEALKPKQPGASSPAKQNPATKSVPPRPAAAVASPLTTVSKAAVPSRRCSSSTAMSATCLASSSHPARAGPTVLNASSATCCCWWRCCLLPACAAERVRGSGTRVRKWVKPLPTVGWVVLVSRRCSSVAPTILHAINNMRINQHMIRQPVG